MSKLRRLVNTADELLGFSFRCPGCRMVHQPRIARAEYAGPSWSFNGDMEEPTFRPSLLVRFPWGSEQKEEVCHSFVTGGMIMFLGDCTHELRNQTVEIPDWEDPNWSHRE